MALPFEKGEPMKSFKKFSILLMALLLLGACQQPNNNTNFEDDKLKVVTSFTLLADLVIQIGQDYVSVYNLVPTGTDPHDYEPLPQDNKAATDADVLIYNGLNLEGGTSGWFFKLINSVKQNKSRVFEVSDGVEPMYLKAGQKDEQINPHAFLDPQVGIIMVNNILNILLEVDPDHEIQYRNNAFIYLEKLEAIHQQYQEKINALPENHRVFTASEHAFQYMTERYGLEHLYIWEIDTDEIGTPQQIRQLIDQLKMKQPPVLFLESNVQTKPMEQVSKETGIPIYPIRIYADEIGQKGSEVDTYLKFLEHNLKVIIDGLSTGG